MSDGLAPAEVPAVEPPAERKIAIIGKAPSSQKLAPYADPSWEIWTLSDIPFTKEVPRWDRHIEIHDPAYIKERHSGGGYWTWLGEQPAGEKPIFVRELTPHIPAGVLFPKDEILAQFGTRYFTNTVSWCIALAIHERPTVLGLWGVDMACKDEYVAQRPSCEYFLGVASGLGIELVIPGQCDLLKCRKLYGFEDDADFTQKFKARSAELQGRVNQLSQQRDNLSLQTAFMEGALSAQEWYSQWLQREW
jgi:hypothetical protein